MMVFTESVNFSNQQPIVPQNSLGSLMLTRPGWITSLKTGHGYFCNLLHRVPVQLAAQTLLSS